jgi:hypothetical protein
MRHVRFAMVVWFLLASILLLCPSPAHAQSHATSRGTLKGTVWGGGLWGGSDVFPHGGGTLELWILPRVSLGGEAGVVMDREDKTVTFLVSARALYAFANPSTAESAWVPFVAAGLTHAVEKGFTFGGGAEYWGRGQFALRLEALAHLFDYGRFVGFRAGFAFRRSAQQGP